MATSPLPSPSAVPSSPLLLQDKVDEADREAKEPSSFSLFQQEQRLILHSAPPSPPPSLSLSHLRKRPFAPSYSLSELGGSFKERMLEMRLDEEEKGVNQFEERVKVESPPLTRGTRKRSRWDSTLSLDSCSVHPHKWDETPLVGHPSSSSPVILGESEMTSLKKNRWDETPLVNSLTNNLRPTSLLSTHVAQAKEASDARTRTFTDEELNALLPGEADDYEVVPVPESYTPVVSNAKKLSATPFIKHDGFFLANEPLSSSLADSIPALPEVSGLPPFHNVEDQRYFACLLDKTDDSQLKPAELKKRRILRLLLKIKNGLAPQRKTALRIITEKACELGAGPLFDAILPLLMSPSLEDGERHVLVKVIGRILYRLDDLVRPYVHKILVVIEPLLIDENYYARIEGREIISNLAKAAGLASMIATMRPDIDHEDDYVRNTTARAFAVVASALGVHPLLPFVCAVCASKRTWQARHTGMKIVQQIAILMGMAVLPHLKTLVETVGPCLHDGHIKVKCVSALAIAALAEASTPYGIESFDTVLRPLWLGVKQQRGKALAYYLKAIGFIIPLMDPSYASYYTRVVMPIIIREFASPDEEMKKVVLKALKQCVSTEGIDKPYIVETVLPDFFRCFWIRKMALDRRNQVELVATTVSLSERVGALVIVERLTADLKDESEVYRRMVLECCERVLSSQGVSELTPRVEESLIDGALFVFQEQQSDQERSARDIMNAFGLIVLSLAKQCKPYLPQIAGIIKWRLNHKSPKVRGQAAELLASVASVMKECQETALLAHLSQVCYEFLGEEYPEVLASLLVALNACLAVLGVDEMAPSVKDLLPRLTPILKNRHEGVSEQCIALIGRIADQGAASIHAKEWMRICFELLELLKAPRLRIRKATVATFGFISKAIGPHDVLATLLNHLRVQDRQNRVCCCVAIAIVAEQCAPFTVLPALINEYSVPELNVQNGVLKALSFVFEYIGENAADYVYACIPVLEDALTDRDVVHRQIACTVVKHMALSCRGLGREDAFIHLLNLVWPNIFETSPHVMIAVFDAIEACRFALGPHYIMLYLAQGLFHPARMVRQVYWRIYNNTLIGAQDGCVACFPRIPTDDRYDFQRHELEMFL